MKSILAAVVAALLVIMLVPVSAQKNVNLDGKQKADEAERAVRDRDRKDTDRQYKGAMDRLPDQKPDPWRNMR